MNVFTPPPTRFLASNVGLAKHGAVISETPVRSWSEKRNIIPKKIFKKVAIVNKEGGKRGRKAGPIFIASDKYCPVALPQAIVDLFRNPHVFPDIPAEEILKKMGYKPRVIMETSVSRALFSESAINLTENKIERLLKKRATGDPELLEKATQLASTAPIQEQRVTQTSSETFRVCYRNGIIKFNPVKVMITRIRPTVLTFYQSFNDL